MLRWLAAASILAVVCSLGCGSKPTASSVKTSKTDAKALDPGEVAEFNRGVAFLGRYNYDQALPIFEKIAQKHPDWVDGQLALAVAMLNRDQGGGRAKPILS